MTLTWRTFTLILLALGSSGLKVDAQSGIENRFPFQKEDRLEGALPSPDQYFGIPLGERFTPYHEMLGYFRALAEKSDRLSMHSYGKSVEGRDLVLLFIGSPETLSRLEAVERRQAVIADPRRRDDPGAPIDSLLDGHPAVLWLSYNVHGNEASASEAALWTAYQLLDGIDEASKKIREDALVIVDPCLNPDGHERYQQWYHSVAAKGGNPDPRSREHSEPWPGGRSNHYLFDLNRDWAWQSQPETQQRIVEYLRWWPLVHVDFHEMSPESSYFFFPPAEPINPNVDQRTLKWAETIGRANATAFDRFGWLYYTAEAFDLFYPAYGDSWPSLQGAVGMTYEQAGGPRAGLRYLRRDGTELTLSERLHHHHVAGMATLLSAVQGKKALQSDFAAFRQGAIEAGRTGKTIEYLFPPGQGERLERMVSLLAAQGIEVRIILDEVIAEGLTSYTGDSQEVTKLPEGTISISLDQPTGRLANALLAPRVEVSDAYFYDVSAWSLPMAMGIDGFHTGTPFAAVRVPLPREPRKGHVEGEARYAYLLPWDGTPAARALQALHHHQLPMRMIPEPISIAGRSYTPGTIVVPVTGAETHRWVREVAKSSRTTFHAVDSGWTEQGMDLGSDSAFDLLSPRIAVACGTGVSSLSYGAVWSLLEQELEVPFSAVQLENFGSLNLDQYDVIVLPSGRGYRSELGGDSLDKLRRWVRGGGTLIALAGAAFSLGAEGLKLVDRETQIDPPPRELSAKKTRQTIADLREHREEHQVPGNIFRIELDPEHPLAFGMPEKIFAFMEGTRTFALVGDGGDVGAFTSDPAASGYISDENAQKIASRVYLADERIGRGHVILFSGDPNFRGFWHGLTGLFVNAIYLRATH